MSQGAASVPDQQDGEQPGGAHQDALRRGGPGLCGLHEGLGRPLGHEGHFHSREAKAYMASTIAMVSYDVLICHGFIRK